MDLLAGECTPSEAVKIRTHLAGCPGCTRQLEDLEAVGSLLDTLEPGEAPPELKDAIMGAVEEIAGTLTVGAGAGKGGGRGPAGPERRPTAALLRDLTAAAAVALVAVWLGSGWLGSLFSTAGDRFSGAVLSYVHFTGQAMNRAQVSVSSINRDFFSSLPKNYTQGSDQQ